MRTPTCRIAAAGFLCAVAATIAVWAGPLAAVSGALHSSSQPQAHASAVSGANTTRK